jgi:hypothetical protein
LLHRFGVCILRFIISSAASHTLSYKCAQAARIRRAADD